MNKKIIPLTIILVIITICVIVVINMNNKEDKNVSKISTDISEKNRNIEEDKFFQENTNTINNNTIINKERDNIKMVTDVRAIINNKEYKLKLEDNETVLKFLEMLPKELTMNELNGNEKYAYVDTSLPTNSYNPKHINIGDVMLFGNNCLVVFYKSFETSYSYTKIGHIDNLPDLGSENITVKFEK